MGGGFEFPRGTDTPGVEEFPRGVETSGGTLKGNRVPGADGWGKVGDGNSPAARDTEGTTATRHREYLAIGQEPEAPPSVTRGMAEVERGMESQVSTQRHSDSADGARPNHSAFARRDYSLLLTEGSAINTTITGPLGNGETTGTGETKVTETGTGERVMEQSARAPCAWPTRGRVGGTPLMSARA